MTNGVTDVSKKGENNTDAFAQKGWSRLLDFCLADSLVNPARGQCQCPRMRGILLGRQQLFLFWRSKRLGHFLEIVMTFQKA